MIIYLNVPFKDKDKAKSLGAKWNHVKKHWYIENMDNLEPFAKWNRDIEAPEPEKRHNKPVSNGGWAWKPQANDIPAVKKSTNSIIVVKAKKKKKTKKNSRFHDKLTSEKVVGRTGSAVVVQDSNEIPWDE